MLPFSRKTGRVEELRLDIFGAKDPVNLELYYIQLYYRRSKFQYSRQSRIDLHLLLLYQILHRFPVVIAGIKASLVIWQIRRVELLGDRSTLDSLLKYL